MFLGQYEYFSVALDRRRKKIEDSNEKEVVPKVDDVPLVDGVFNGAFGGDGDEDFLIGEEEFEEEACVDAMDVEEK
ncbi:hypothetical protein Tco_0539337 [Tanacetum coccineum]